MVKPNCKVSPQWSDTSNRKGGKSLQLVRLNRKTKQNWFLQQKNKIFNSILAPYQGRDLLCVSALIFINVKTIFLKKEPTVKTKVA